MGAQDGSGKGADPEEASVPEGELPGAAAEEVEPNGNKRICSALIEHGAPVVILKHKRYHGERGDGRKYRPERKG
jgi:hypothetical protein